MNEQERAYLAGFELSALALKSAALDGIGFAYATARGGIIVHRDECLDPTRAGLADGYLSAFGFDEKETASYGRPHSAAAPGRTTSGR